VVLRFSRGEKLFSAPKAGSEKIFSQVATFRLTRMRTHLQSGSTSGRKWLEMVLSGKGNGNEMVRDEALEVKGSE